ncbi:MFS general substrate transporter [Pleomassaria siparia CBS 279.74]|uniref:MFS general substrate transporter n=1 Tax=Pleomassaria siparia CBS 279.74 TaxID=1314801 RepID=A0A6G1JYP3_9PLEO|nr:MFS general substrate transporter [Pleomassaria siparia CBS 279.74]
MVAVDATILVAVLPEIALSLHGTSTHAFWAGTSYLLSSAVFQPVIASISTFFGRQQLLLLSLVFFTLGIVFCAAANDFTVLLVGRSVQGIGGGGIITLSQVIFCDIVPLRLRPKYFAWVLMSWSIGTTIGPITGGALVERTTWRWVFIVNSPFCVLGFVLAAFFVRIKAGATLTFSQKLKQVDWTLAPIITGVVVVMAFVAWQIWINPRSLLPMSIFYCPSAIAAFYCAMANGLLLFSALYCLPFYYIGLFLLLDLHTSYAILAVILETFGMGCGMVLTSVNVGIQAISKVEDCVMAASMYGFFRSLGMPFGIVLSGTMFQNAMKSQLLSYGLPGEIAHDSERYIYVLRTMAIDDPKRAAILDSYLKGFRGVFVLMTCVAASALAVSLFIKRFDMNKKLAENRFRTTE